MQFSRRFFLTSLAISPLALNASTLFADDEPNAKSSAEAAPLAFRDGRFKILQLTDLHLGFAGDGFAKAEATLDVVRRLLAAEKPDVAILTGDVVTLNPDDLKGGVAEAWARVAKPFEDAQTPFAVAFGNHDHERKESAAEMLAAIQKSPWNRTKSDDPTLSGAGNCAIPVVGADGKEKRRLWLFDSLSYPKRGGLSTYDWIQSDQIAWYRRASEEARAANGGAPVPALAFFHIPLPEYWKIHQDPKTFGVANEDVCSPELNSGLFTAFVEREDVEGVFVGHDHVNDYVGIYKNVALVYGRKTGVDSYGNLPQGGRIIEVTENERGFKTYDVDADGRSNEYAFTPQE